MQHNPPPFSESQYFVHPLNRRGKQQFSRWQCTVCTDLDCVMTSDEALLHEMTQEHARNIPKPDPVVSSGWGAPLTAANAWLEPPPEENDKQFFLCEMSDYIPFWVRGVRLAEEGEYLRLEDFLDDVEKANRLAWEASRRQSDDQRSPKSQGDEWSQGSNNGWRENHHGWGNDNNGWQVDHQVWGNAKDDSEPSGWGPRPTIPDTLPESADDECPGHLLVDRIIQSRAVNPDKAQSLHKFFDMPTATKLQEIDKLIQELRPFFV